MELVHTILQFSTESHFCLLDSELRGSKFLWLKGGIFLIVDFLLPQKLTANTPLKVRRMEVDIDGFQKRSKSVAKFFRCTSHLLNFKGVDDNLFLFGIKQSRDHPKNLEFTRVVISNIFLFSPLLGHFD